MIWKLNRVINQFEVLHVLDDGTKTNLIVSDAVIGQGGSISTATSANDFSLRFWSDEILRSKVGLKNYAFDLKIIKTSSYWSQDAITLAYGGADCNVILCQLNHKNVFTELFKFSGHSDWIRSIDYRYTTAETLFIASAAQDNFIRVWKVSTSKIDKNSIKIEQTFMDQSKDQLFVVCLETVLAGHEAPVNCVKFIPSKDSRLSVISSSLDKSVVVWEEPEDESGGDIWSEKFRVGEIGGNNMGFLGVSFPLNSNSLTRFCAYSYNGSVHLWRLEERNGSWVSDIGCGGHFDAVNDIAWDVRGNYLLSTSTDETTRLHGVWCNGTSRSWHEIARPQIHGYLINCLASLNEFTFISGADEKVLRVFRATKRFVNSLKSISGIEMSIVSDLQLPDVAMTPALGLSNRAVFSGAQITKEGDVIEPHSSLEPLHCPPTEELLMESTLWPEIHKLYGHGHEVFAVAASHDGKLVASTCKATKTDQAGLILWDACHNFKKIQILPGHSLTVTSIKFSADDRLIVSVSRDRTWFLYQRNNEDQFVKVANSDKKSGIHSRIIWDVSWTPDSKYFITASRDKKLIVWRAECGMNVGDVSVMPVLNSILTLDEAVMSVDVYGKCWNGRYLVALGLENGTVQVFTWDTVTWTRVHFENESLLRHSLCVRKVRFAPFSSDEPRRALMATCGEDYLVQIFAIEL